MDELVASPLNTSINNTPNNDTNNNGNSRNGGNNVDRALTSSPDAGVLIEELSEYLTIISHH